MTPEHAAERLLEHGPLTSREFLQITGWSAEKAERVLTALVIRGVVAVLPHEVVNRDRYWLRRQLPTNADYDPQRMPQLRTKPVRQRDNTVRS